VTASFATLAWPPVLGSLGQGFKYKKLRSAHSPHQAAGCSKDQNSTSWSPENCSC
jgi:hypothetical protein